MVEEIITEIHKGNGNQFSIKEILQAKIRDDKDFQNKVMDKFENGTGKIAENRTRIDSIIKGMIYGIGPILLLILGWLARIQLKK